MAKLEKKGESAKKCGQSEAGGVLFFERLCIFYLKIIIFAAESASERPREVIQLAEVMSPADNH